MMRATFREKNIFQLLRQLAGCAACLMVSSAGITQDSANHHSLVFSGYADVYYGYDFNEPGTRDRPFFLYNHKRHNEFATNLVLLKAAYQHNNITANIGIMTGTYAQYNLATEPSLFQHVYEANLGYAFSRKLSLEAGILPSHLGIESAVSKDNWNLSRSMLAENSPYYETGIKLNYVPNNNWKASLLVLNGWQNIRETNSGKAIGTQIQYKPNGKWLFNSSTFIGNEKPDTARQLRLFHNFYATYSPSEKLGFSWLADIGAEKNRAASGYHNWWGLAMLTQYKFNSRWIVAGRIEQYKDEKGVIIFNNNSNGFNTMGYAANVDFQPAAHIVFRTEARFYRSRQAIFEKNGTPTKNNFSMLGSIAVWF